MNEQLDKYLRLSKSKKKISYLVIIISNYDSILLPFRLFTAFTGLNTMFVNSTEKHSECLWIHLHEVFYSALDSFNVQQSITVYTYVVITVHWISLLCHLLVTVHTGTKKWHIKIMCTSTRIDTDIGHKQHLVYHTRRGPVSCLVQSQVAGSFSSQVAGTSHWLSEFGL